MNQYKIDFFLKYASHHTVNVGPHISGKMSYCEKQSCEDCVHCITSDSNPDCSFTLLKDDELGYLTLNYPEYFL